MIAALVHAALVVRSLVFSCQVRHPKKSCQPGGGTANLKEVARWEFEVAQLTLLKAEHLLGDIEIIQGQTEIIESSVTQGNTLLFGYLVAAYSRVRT